MSNSAQEKASFSKCATDDIAALLDFDPADVGSWSFAAFRCAALASASIRSADVTRTKWRLYRYPDFVADASRNGGPS
jgi:hypothetical protein